MKQMSDKFVHYTASVCWETNKQINKTCHYMCKFPNWIRRKDYYIGLSKLNFAAPDIIYDISFTMVDK